MNTTAAVRLQPNLMKPAPLPVRALFALAGKLFPQTLAGFIAGRMLRPRRGTRTLQPEAVAGARLLRIAHGEHHLNAYLWGTQGPLVLLVHGWEGWIDDMGAFVPPLRRAGFSVAALELPAHGQSALQATDVHDIAAALHSFAAYADRELGRLHAVIAHSLGAAATVKFLTRCSTALPRVSLIAPGGELAAELQRLSQQLALPPACVAALRQRLEAHYGLAIEDCSSRRLAAQLQVPALVVHDRHDHLVPFAEGHALARQLRGARFIATDGLGHHRILSDTALVGQITAFCTHITRLAVA